jgi:hypothetical protein
MKRAVLVAAVASLALPAAAAAGGWATVGVANLPDGVRAGDVWNAQITVLRHGRTPTDGARPVVTIVNTDGTSKSFAAKPGRETGTYVARVVFPSGGTWRFSIDNGLSATGYGVDATTTFAPVEIAPPGGGGDGDSAPILPLVLGALSAAAIAAVLVLTIRRRAHQAVPAS